MMSTIKTSKNSSGNASNSDKNDDNAIEIPITEEELKEKGTAITINDVLRLTKPMKEYLTKTDDNIYQIDFVHFRIRDMKTNKILFDVERASDHDEHDDDDDHDISAGRFVHYHFPSAFLKLKQIGALVDFTVGNRPVKSFRMIERHYFRDRLIKSFDFDFGFCLPNSRNSIEHIYDMPQFDSKEMEEMIAHPNETKSDSFYFVENQLIMHKKATYAFDLDRY